MANESGTWIMHGLDWDNPYRIRTYRELINWINEIGFLPLFKNEVEGFSAEEHVSPLCWWTGDAENDPWEWREIIARSGEVVYGKFFGKKTGFVSKEWFPVFANYRRDGYDFDARWDDELANIRNKRIMDCFEGSLAGDDKEHIGLQLKKMAVLGKDCYKNFDGMMTELQMQTYLVVKDFRCKRNKHGLEYGMPVCVYSKPEDLWGYDMVTTAYSEKPEDSREKIFAHVRELYPDATEKQLAAVLK